MPPKAKPKKQPRSPLTSRPPSGLSATVSKAYKALANELAAEGYACQADWRTVAMAARKQIHAERLRNAVDDLASLTTSSAGGEKVHPLVMELRAVDTQLLAIYAQLLLTPRSRSASRMTEGQARTAASKTDDMEDFLGE